MKVTDIIESIKTGDSTRFSKQEFESLICAVLSDEEFNVKRHFIKNGELKSEDMTSHRNGIRKFMDKLLKHAGLANATERTAIIDSFTFTSKDIEWVSEAIDEAMNIYTDCGKSIKIFRNSMVQLTLRKAERTGKHAGKITYRKTVLDRALVAAKNAKATT